MINIIAAVSVNGGLGANGSLLYKIPQDLKRFKRMTSGGIVIMGRKTFEEIGKPLPERINIVLTSDVNYSPKGAIVQHSLRHALEECKRWRRDVWICGGGKVYAQALEANVVDNLYLTIISDGATPPYADVFFPATYVDKMYFVGGQKEHCGKYELDHQIWRRK